MTYLTPAERCILDAIVEGKGSQQIADERFVCLSTIKHQIKDLMTKLNAKTRAQAVAHAYQEGVLPLEVRL